MRTTLDIDQDVLPPAKEITAQSFRPCSSIGFETKNAEGKFWPEGLIEP